MKKHQASDESHNLDDSVAVHALNGLPSAERFIVEVTLEFDEDLASNYRRYRGVAGKLAEALSDVGPAPSPQLWDRIAAAVGLPAAPTDQSPDKRETPAAPRR